MRSLVKFIPESYELTGMYRRKKPVLRNSCTGSLSVVSKNGQRRYYLKRKTSTGKIKTIGEIRGYLERPRKRAIPIKRALNQVKVNLPKYYKEQERKKNAKKRNSRKLENIRVQYADRQSIMSEPMMMFDDDDMQPMIVVPKKKPNLYLRQKSENLKNYKKPQKRYLQRKKTTPKRSIRKPKRYKSRVKLSKKT